MLTAKQVYEGFRTTIDKEPPLVTMRKKLIINVATTGAFTTKQQNPRQPVTMRENVENAIGAYRAGASMWHVHARSEDGLPNKDPKVFKETIARVLDQCPDIITSVVPYANYDSHGVEQIRPIVDHLTEAGPAFMQTAVLLTSTETFSDKFAFMVTQPLLDSIVKYLEERGIKPEFQCYNYSGAKDVHEWIIQPGVAKRPYLFNLMTGFHGHSYASPLSPEPWNYVSLISAQQSLPAQPPDAVVGICAGGRNWLPFTTMAIVLGFDVVRVGMEDSVYLYPYADEKINNCADVVRKVANIARELGREIATPAEARQIMGLRQG